MTYDRDNKNDDPEEKDDEPEAKDVVDDAVQQITGTGDYEVDK